MNQPLHATTDVVRGGEGGRIAAAPASSAGCGSVVGENDHVGGVVRKAVVGEEALHVDDIVGAAAELGFGSGIVYADEESPTATGWRDVVVVELVVGDG